MEGYVGRQFVGSTPHRRRSVIVRTTAAGAVLEALRIANDVDRLTDVLRPRVMARRWCWRQPAAGCDVMVHEGKWEAPLKARRKVVSRV